MRLKIQKAFTLVELLVSLVIAGMLGGVATVVLWFSVASYHQMNDYGSAESEMAYAAQRLSRDFALIGLGMPNNRRGVGSFVSTFSYSSNAPIMAFFGSDSGADPKWGGPVVVANATGSSGYSAATITNPGLLSGTTTYVGPELYYAWGVPTGVKARFRTPTGAVEVEKNDIVEIGPFFAPEDTGRDYLEKLRYRDIGGNFTPSVGANSVRRWLLFPTLRLPMLAESWTTKGGEDVLTARVAPESTKNVKGVLMGLDEIHLIQAARLFRNDNNELVRVVFDTGSSSETEVLARHVVGLHFAYDPDSRLLTMYIAARGTVANGTGHTLAQPKDWPSWLPPIDASELPFRILTKSLTWRIRN
ncbi:MAG: prepilin-type N-terminal cleavage/methylation domain-containing protein [Synergistaceae bacterium]|jgi:prepilin-type N-terminal cleavage/methylation domain-containing protein|nr:prepilin-type N-terminal cleavage/methylation domain-containing protein [Synergistaceae bacterium]